MSDLVIRSGRLRDLLEAWRCAGHVARGSPNCCFREGPGLTECRRFWATLIQRGDPFLVALCPRLVGWADIVPATASVHAHIGTLGLGVIGNARGEGIGTGLLTAAMEAARARGLERLETTLLADDERSQRFYRKMGFVVEGVQAKRAKHNGRYRDEILMAGQL